MRTSDGSWINVVRYGAQGASPVLLIHAVGLDLTWWDRQFDGLGHDFDVAAFDLPGHGLSDPLVPKPSFEALASIASEVIASLAAGPCHVVGVSVGGMIAQMLALTRPDLVRSLTLVATLCTFPEPVRELLRDRARMTRENGMQAVAPLTQERWFPATFRERRPDVVDRALKSLLRHDPGVHAAMWDMIAELDLEASVPAIKTPTLVVAGAEDGNAPAAAGQRIADLVPGAMLRVLAGVGHQPPVEASIAFNDLLRAHLLAS